MLYYAVMLRGENTPGSADYRPSRLIAGMLAISAAAALYTGLTDREENFGDTIATAPGQSQAALPAPECPAPSQESIVTVTRMLDEPRPFTEMSPTGSWMTQVGYSEHIDQKADELGIEFVKPDYRKIKTLYKALNSYGADKPFKAYQEVAEDVLNQHGINLQIGLPAQYEDGAKTLSESERESPAIKQEVLELTYSFASTPRNLTKHLGLKTIALIAHSTDYATAHKKTQTMAVDIFNIAGMGKHKKVEMTKVIDHEIGHFIQYKACGIADRLNDTAYIGLNNKAGYKFSTLPQDSLKSQPTPLDKAKRRHVSLINIKSEALYNKQKSAYCRAEIDIENAFADIEMVSDFSYKNVAEDVAEIQGRLLKPESYAELLDKRTPVIRAKAIMQTARLHELAPEVARYYTLQAVRPPVSVADCTDTRILHRISGDDVLDLPAMSR